MKKCQPGQALFCLLIASFILSASGLLTACSFDYGGSQNGESSKPDIVMENVEYVRVRGGDPIVRFQAESAEQYETTNMMNLKKFSFEEFTDHGNEVNAAGSAEQASVETDTGNIELSGGVKITIESEDFVIETSELWWRDREKQLSGGSDEQVLVRRSDGSSFSGWGFSADIRERAWTFSSGINGVYVDSGKDDSEE